MIGRMDMKERAIVYGLGKRFLKYRDILEDEYEIIGYCDIDDNKVEQFSQGITRGKLHELGGYDKIVIVPANAIDIAADLINELNIPINKIEVFTLENREPIGRSIFPTFSFHGKNNEDAVLILLMQQLHIKISDIRYLEIGTNHPVSGNQTYSLYCKGARGILVEPLRQEFELLIKLFRPEDTAIFTAVTGHALHREEVFYEAENLYRSSLDIHHHPAGMAVKEIIVDLLGINELLDKIGFIPDLLVVDAEGEDENILRALDFGKYSPKVIMAEMATEDFVHFMQQKGYIWYCEVGGNTIYYRQDLEIEVY